jgi:hypothetical protein
VFLVAHPEVLGGRSCRDAYNFQNLSYDIVPGRNVVDPSGLVEYPWMGVGVILEGDEKEKA